MRDQGARALAILALLIACAALGLVLAMKPWQSPAERVVRDLGSRMQAVGDAYTQSMQSALRDVNTAQEAYFHDHRRFASDLTALDYQPANGVTVTIDAAGVGAWSASATSAYSDQQCRIAADQFGPNSEPTCSAR